MAPEEIRTPDPQIRSFGSDTEIIAVFYRTLDGGNEETCVWYGLQG